ncbi:MAG: hypothetical protein HY982_01605 [Candidatus Magasanikbacteria bacterium]|nr:hypothetical protein [Candidatus Magasanikbacteria bacterium]
MLTLHHTEARLPPPLELISAADAAVLRDLRDLNGLTEEETANLALLLAGEKEETQILLFEHQRSHYQIIARLRELGLKVRREHLNFQRYNKENNADLRTVILISRK